MISERQLYSALMCLKTKFWQKRREIKHLKNLITWCLKKSTRFLKRLIDCSIRIASSFYKVALINKRRFQMWCGLELWNRYLQKYMISLTFWPKILNFPIEVSPQVALTIQGIYKMESILKTNLTVLTTCNRIEVWGFSLLKSLTRRLDRQIFRTMSHNLSILVILAN